MHALKLQATKAVIEANGSCNVELVHVHYLKGVKEDLNESALPYLWLSNIPTTCMR